MKAITITTFISFFLLTLMGSILSCQKKGDKVKNEKRIANPISEIACADPSIVQYEGKYYIYATVDPWGGEELVVLESDDFLHWERKHIQWPNLTDCSSPTSGRDRVWAPGVTQGKDGRFYMYVTVHNEIWVGESDRPLGPWRNAKEDGTPLIKGDMFPEYHMIDAEAFVDTDGQAYLYWGSGLNWENGHCFVVPLAEDMVTFDAAEIRDVTPPNYFEAPYMLKKDGKYHLMYSQGKCVDRTYMIRSAVGDTPYGPWVEEESSPIVSTSVDSTTLGPGHHTVFQQGGQDYILYHRIRDNNGTLLRELVIDSLNFDPVGQMKTVKANGGVVAF